VGQPERAHATRAPQATRLIKRCSRRGRHDGFARGKVSAAGRRGWCLASGRFPGSDVDTGRRPLVKGDQRLHGYQANCFSESCMQPVDFSAPVRAQRGDLTDYVVHLTRRRIKPAASPLQVLIEILNLGYIRPTFAPYTSRSSGGRTRPGVKGPYRVVCLTEQPISALIKTLKYASGRYSGYGIAYYKPILYDRGGRPVLYGSDQEIGQKIKQGEPGWEEGKEVYRGGLPPDLQYLWVRYDPLGLSVFQYKIDFTWEREWRVKFPNPWFKEVGLPIALRNPWSAHLGAVLVSKESEVAQVRSCIDLHRERGAEWAQYINKVISLEKAAQSLEANDHRYARLESWPDKE
jgi:hypothetical protein